MTDSTDHTKRRKRVKNKEKVKIHYRQKVKLTHRPSVWSRYRKYMSKNRKMIIVVSLLVIGVVVSMTSVFLTVKQKSDKHKELMEQKFIPPVGK